MGDAERLCGAHNGYDIKTHRPHHPLSLNISIGRRKEKTHLFIVHRLLGRAEPVGAASLNLYKNRYAVLKGDDVYILVADPIVCVEQRVSVLYEMASCHHLANSANLIM